MLQKKIPHRFKHRNNPRESVTEIIVDPLEGLTETVKKFCDKGISGKRGFFHNFLFAIPEDIAYCLDEYFDIKKCNFKIIGDNNKQVELTREKIKLVIIYAFEYNFPELTIPEVLVKSIERIANEDTKKSLEQFQSNLAWARETTDESFMNRVMNTLKEIF